jgi:GNAT superfamily N-acetyltransferase
MQHPDHNAVAAEVASWYTSPFPEMGLEVVRSPYGWYRSNASSPIGWVTITDILPDDVQAMLEDVATFYGDRAVELAIEDTTYTPDVGAALEAAGWTDTNAIVWLARVEQGPIVRSAPDIEIERIGTERLDEFSRIKLMGFDNSEDEPSAERIAEESALRRSDLSGTGVCLSARVDDECAAICAYYEGADNLIFVLATRVPFRHRGLARTLIAHVYDEARRSGARSTMINADEGELPEALYRSLGFTDVVYRQRRFRRPDQS